MIDRSTSVRALLAELYPSLRDAAFEEVSAALEMVLIEARARRGAENEMRRCRPDQAHAWLIAYPNQFRRAAANTSCLATLTEFVGARLAPQISGVHTLPIHPSTSDGGFSVTDFTEVDPAVGQWSDVDRLAQRFTWIADAVVNHVSAGGGWFRSFLDGDPAFAGFFVVLPPGVDTTAVVRPRTSPLGHTFSTTHGSSLDVWTTFSADQVDLDYRNPRVLVAMIEVLIRYVGRGASAVRLDAIAYVWKDVGHPSIHHPQAHLIVQMFRACLDQVDPTVLLITETNVAHTENVSYFGQDRPDARGEADAVYQFALPPLVLHALHTGSAKELRDWAGQLRFPSTGKFFLNFLGSHDGVGLRPVEQLLSTDAIAELARLGEAAGGVVNWRAGHAGPEPYEIAVSWFDLMAAGVDENGARDRHLAAHAIALALRGVPLLYFNSLFGIDNDDTTFEITGHGRDLNRGRSDHARLCSELIDPLSRPATIWTEIRRMLDLRRSCAAFHPDAEQVVHDAPDAVLVIERTASDGSCALVVINVAGTAQTVGLPGGPWTEGDSVVGASMTLSPWSSAWLFRPSPTPTSSAVTSAS